MLYAFLLTVWAVESPVADVYVMESGLSGSECMAAMQAYNSDFPDWARGVPSCEIDPASLPAVFTHKGQQVTLPPCPTEDSNNCYWDAGERGDGYGQSFYVIDDKVFPFEP